MKSLFGPVDWSRAALPGLGTGRGSSGAAECSGCAGCSGSTASTRGARGGGCRSTVGGLDWSQVRPLGVPVGGGAVAQVEVGSRSGSSRSKRGPAAAFAFDWAESSPGDPTPRVFGCNDKVLVAPSEGYSASIDSGEDDAVGSAKVTLPCTGSPIWVDEHPLEDWETDYAGGGDPLQDEATYASLRAPDALTRAWSLAFPFDEPGFEWLCLRVAYQPYVNRCDPSPGPDERSGGGGTYVAMALQPYAAFEILDTEDRGSIRRIQVRYFVGLTNHFTIFIPPRDWQSYFRGDTRVQRYGVEALQTLRDGGFWEPRVGGPTGRGELARQFMSLIRRLHVDVQSTVDPDTGYASTQRAWFDCDPAENDNASSFGDTYVCGQRGGAALLQQPRWPPQ